MDLTVILPSAGEGSRLNLTYPKELYEIQKGLKLIDLSLQHIKNYCTYSKNNLKISVVITPKKEDVFFYVKEQLPFLEVNKIYFNNNYKEWPGSVFSAQKTFSDNNIVLLPDTNIALSKKNKYLSESGKSIFEIGLDCMDRFEAVFGYIKTNNKIKLMNLGAMNVIHGKVKFFKDKPNRRIQNYNSFWGCYGFKKKSAKKLYIFLEQSVLNKTNSITTIPPFNFGAFPLYSFEDLGTWDGIELFLNS